ncbi:MAG TPA: type IV pilin protein [Methylotenera sp.]|nr:type IV pilin protein [Methylotenera sp.]
MTNATLLPTATHGFTLIELLITVVIISLLAMIAVPSYNQSIGTARRVDAQAELSNFAAAMERHFTETGSYTGAAGTSGSPVDTGSPWIFAKQTPLDSNSKFYNLTIVTANAATFTLRATPINAQLGDGYLEITSVGVQRWDKNNDGDTNDAGENRW